MRSTAVVEPSTSAPAANGAARGRRKIGSRLSGGHLIMIVAGLLAFVLVVTVLQDNKKQILVATASRDIQPGETLTDGDVVGVKISANSGLASELYSVNEVLAETNKVTNRPIAEGEPITIESLTDARSDGKRTMSIPLDASKANGGDLQRGDTIDVLSLDEADLPYVVASDLRIVDITKASSGGFASGSGTITITVAVDEDQSLVLVGAIETGKIHAVRSSGASSTSGEG